MNKRDKSSSSVIKFTFFLVLVFLVGFLIFYSIDNPGFLKNKMESIFGGNGENEEASPVLDTAKEVQINDDSGEAESIDGLAEVDAGKNSVESSRADDINVSDSGDNGEEEANDSESGTSLWQKIKDFFAGLAGRGSATETGNDYPATMKINIYFSGIGEEDKLVSEERTINAGCPEVAARNAVKELLKGPSRPYHFPVIPAGTRLLRIETGDDIVIVDFSQEFLEESLDSRILDKYIIYSIVNTLTEIKGIEGVVFYIEGVRIKVYGNVDLSIPAIRNKELIDEETDEA